MKKLRILTASDLHQRQNLYHDLGYAVSTQQPDLLLLVGDFLNHDASLPDTIPEEECARLLAQVPSEIAFARGNHEAENWWLFAQAWESTGRPLHTLNGAIAFGPLVVVGFPSLLGNDEPFLNGRESLSSDASDWMPDIIRTFGPACRTLWLMHEPPSGTRLSSNDGGPTSGHVAWREAIEKYFPRLVISGHDHSTPIMAGVWQDKIGDTTCVNLGQCMGGPLRYLLIDLAFPKESPCLPATCKLSAIIQ